MSVRIQQADFDLAAELAAFARGDPRIGALVAFVGLVRDASDADTILEMTLEHYPGMTESALAEIVHASVRCSRPIRSSPWPWRQRIVEQRSRPVNSSSIS